MNVEKRKQKRNFAIKKQYKNSDLKRLSGEVVQQKEQNAVITAFYDGNFTNSSVGFCENVLIQNGDIGIFAVIFYRNNYHDRRIRLKTLKTITKHVGNTKLKYTAVFDGVSYGLEITAAGDFDGYILVEDVSRELQVAEYLAELFAENLVFPQNALEIFDDLLGAGKDFTNCY